MFYVVIYCMLTLCSLCVHDSFISYGKNVNALFTKNLQKFLYLFIVCSQFAELFNRAPDAQNLETTDSTQEYFPTLKIKEFQLGGGVLWEKLQWFCKIVLLTTILPPKVVFKFRNDKTYFSQRYSLPTIKQNIFSLPLF